MSAAIGVVALIVLAYLLFRDELATPPQPPASVRDTAPEPSRSPGRPRAAETPTPEIDADAAARAMASERANWPIRVTTNVPGCTVTMTVRTCGADAEPEPVTKAADASGFAGFDAPAKSVPVHEIGFVARAEGFRPGRASSDQAGDVSIELVKAVVVRGRVEDATGRRIARAVVKVQGEPGEPPVETDAVGQFETFAAKPGEVVVHVENGSYVTRDLQWTAPASDVVIVLERGLEVSGRIAFPDGSPVAGAHVKNTAYSSWTYTDADGRYVLSGLARGAVEIECDVSDEQRNVDAGSTGIDFQVKRPVARVRFVDPQGRPYRFVAPHIRVHKGDVDVYSYVSSGGIEDADELVEGRAGATLFASGSGANGEKGSITFPFGDEPKLHDVPVVIGAQKPTGTARFVVRFGTAEIPRAAYVAIEDEAGSRVAGDSRSRIDLDAAGAGELAGVPAGRSVVVVAAAARWSPEALQTFLITARVPLVVEEGRTSEVAVTLELGGRVRATVKDADGEPVAPRDLRILHSSTGQFLDMFVAVRPGGGWTSRLDVTPSLLLDAVKPGRYVVRATMSDGATVDTETEVRAGETTDVELTLKR